MPPVAMIKVNEIPVSCDVRVTVADLAQAHKPGADVFIVNGYPAGPETVLVDGDQCWLIRKGEVPSADEMERLLYARHTPGVHDRVKEARVGIMGLGGLGSMVVTALARVGVGHLLIADYDVVEPSNLNRQQYFINQVGMAKTDATIENLARINPYLQVTPYRELLDQNRIEAIFAGVDVLVECFDSAAAKAMALNTVLGRMPNTPFVCASGLAGFYENDRISTLTLRPGVYMVGDRQSAARPGDGLMAPRVGIAAHHQANQVLRILLGAEAGRQL